MKKRNWLIPVCALLCVLIGCAKSGGIFYTQSGEDGAGQKTQTAEYRERDAQGAESSAGESGGQTAESAGSGCFVHICGAVEAPGVYEMPPGSRIYEVIAAAGGFCGDACEYAVNQAQTVTDGMQIYIPSADEAAAGGVRVSDQNAGAKTESGDTVNINTAGKEQLMTLPGIGEARAEAILDYRRQHGGFASVEELLKVSGIGLGVYEKIKDRVRI